MSGELLTTVALAEAAGVKVWQLRAALAAGLIQSHGRLGQSRIFHQSDVAKARAAVAKLKAEVSK